VKLERITTRLDRDSQLICFVKSNARVVHADNPEGEAEEDDENIPAHGSPPHHVSPKLEVEDTRPDKGEEAACEVSYEAHQDGEVGNEDGKQDGDHYHTDSETEPPNLQLAIKGPY